jgi:hypothetical protein
MWRCRGQQFRPPLTYVMIFLTDQLSFTTSSTDLIATVKLGKTESRSNVFTILPTTVYFHRPITNEGASRVVCNRTDDE